MIPMTLVTGFLGSGKTTLLQRIVETRRDRRLVYLVNEFAPVDIDGRVLDCGEDELISIPGGSIFCRCLVSEFIGHLRAVAERTDAGGASIEGVIVEASGIADPKVVGQMLAETRLDHKYRLAMVVCVVDPGSFLKLMHTLPNILAQVEASDLAIVNKVDLYDEQRVSETEMTLRGINPSVKIVRTSHCQVDLDLFGQSSETALHGEYALCADPNYATASVTLMDDVDLDRLIRELQALGERLYRAKGFVQVGGRRVYVDVSPAGVQTRAAESAKGPAEMVFTVQGEAREQLIALLERIKTGQYLAGNTPTS